MNVNDVEAVAHQIPIEQPESDRLADRAEVSPERQVDHAVAAPDEVAPELAAPATDVRLQPLFVEEIDKVGQEVLDRKVDGAKLKNAGFRHRFGFPSTVSPRDDFRQDRMDPAGGGRSDAPVCR